MGGVQGTLERTESDVEKEGKEDEGGGVVTVRENFFFFRAKDGMRYSQVSRALGCV